jgi:plastocyanin
VSEFRKRVLGPALIPLGAFAFIGVLAYPLSRILLAVTKEGSVVVAVLMAACVLFAAAAVAKGGVMKNVQKISLIAFSLLLLGGGIAVEASLGTREVEGHVEIAATLVAQNIKFDKTEFSVPADHKFGLALDNRDAQPHNVAIYPAKGQQPPLFTFDAFTGPASRVFESGEEGIPEGVYYFQCDVHPSMNGTATAGEAEGPPGPGPAPTGPPTQSPSASPSAAAPEGPLQLIAKNTAFDQKELTFRGGTQVTLQLTNDDALPHNWALYADQAYTQAIFNGEIFSGPAQRRDYGFLAPPPGTYFFKCDVHPNMAGTATST